jgi:hypothetical protein
MWGVFLSHTFPVREVWAACSYGHSELKLCPVRPSSPLVPPGRVGQGLTINHNFLQGERLAFGLPGSDQRLRPAPLGCERSSPGPCTPSP